MRIEEKRKRNLVCLWRQRGILQKDFAKLVGTTPNTFNQYMTGVRKVGNRMALKVEARLKLDEGWMDEVHPEEWDLAKSLYDGRMQSRAMSRIGAEIGARVDALSDERVVRMITEILEIAEERQMGSNPHIKRLTSPKPD